MSRYSPLRDYVSRKGGLRLASHSRLRDRLIDMAVEEWPESCDPEMIADVLKARMAIRVKKQYGSILAMFIISVLVNAIAKIVVEWWFARDSNRVLMMGWHLNASGRQV
jgi:hypothetical protein